MTTTQITDALASLSDFDFDLLVGVGAYRYDKTGRAVTGFEGLGRAALEAGIARLVVLGWIEAMDAWSGLLTTNYRPTKLGDRIADAAEQIASEKRATCSWRDEPNISMAACLRAAGEVTR